MKQLTNEIMLITYPDCMGKDLKDLYRIMDTYFDGLFGGIHILPFFPSSGDRGFAPIDYFQVEPAFGDWEDIRRFSEKYYLMCDFMANHISVQSPEFQDYLQRGDASPYKEMFINWHDFWGGEPSEEEARLVYKVKNCDPKMDWTLADGSKVTLWNTFFDQQMDIDPFKPVTQDYYRRVLTHLARYAALIRLDAFAYTSKRAGTDCFFVEPEVWESLKQCLAPLEGTGTRILPEIHENYHIQMKIVEHGHAVYDFCLPMLLLHAMMTGRSDRLRHWLEICPHDQYTTLDTHDGIGVVDVEGLLEPDEIQLVLDKVAPVISEVRNITGENAATTRGGEERKTYQINCTYYSALGEDDEAYLLCRLIQFFTPGVPQVYYVGLLAGSNDMDFLRRSRQGRDINRHYYTEEEIRETVERPMIKKLFAAMRFRKTHPAFGGDFSVREPAPGQLILRWEKGSDYAQLAADLGRRQWEITCSRMPR